MSENKKDSFTFSDKIKNSKPAFNPFSKRVSSKIGSNGKPKKTLFERTKRDAPFFVAATAALLMLPFLYKYSGTVEEPTSVPPGTVGEDFVPERFDYDPGTGNGEIAQVTGLDPMSLIKRWNADEPQAAYDRERDDLDDDYTPPSRPQRPQASVPSYRQSAPAATKAAFKRAPAAPTKIKEMRGASMASRSAGGIGSRFGGANLKAASKERTAAPKNGTKPVSLTPLRAAGSPSRSYFGQGAAAQARASRDAMGKANATEAVKDAMYNPIENKKVGGLTDGVFASGGGSGPMNRTFESKPITPWWWNMREQQEMEKWKWKYFLWRKPLADGIAKVMADLFGGISKALGCISPWHDKDWDVGNWGTTQGSAGKADSCECSGTPYSSAQDVYEAFGAYLNKPNEKTDFKDYCEGAKRDGAALCEWKAGKAPTGKLGYWGKARNCLNEEYTGKLEGYTMATHAYSCSKLISDHMFKVVGLGAAAKWPYKYHAVVVENRITREYTDDEDDPEKDEPDEEEVGLCSAAPYAGKTVSVSGSANGGGSVRHNEAHKDTRDTEGKNRHVTSRDDFKANKASGTPAIDTTTPEECVIYVAKGDTFDYAGYKRDVTELLNRKGLSFDNLRPVRIEGYIMQRPLAFCSKNGNCFTGLPTMKNMVSMPYISFRNMYVDNATGIFGVQKERQDEDRNWLWQKENPKAKNGKRETACPWGDFSITAKPIAVIGKVEATLAYDEKLYPSGKGITVKVDVLDKTTQLSPVVGNLTPEKGKCAKGTCAYRLSTSVLENDVVPVLDSKIMDQAGKQRQDDKGNPVSFEALFRWTATAGNETSTDDAEYTHGKIIDDRQGVIPPGGGSACKEGETSEVAMPDAGPDCKATFTCVNGKYEFSALSGDCSGGRNGGGNGGGNIEGECNFYQFSENMLGISTSKDDVSKAVFKDGTMSKFSTPSQTLFAESDFDGNDLATFNNAMNVDLDSNTSGSALAFVQNTVDKFVDYRKSQGESCVQFVGDKGAQIPSYRFIEALGLAQNLGVKDVPRSAVCAFVRGVGHKAPDTEVKKGGEEPKNYFGAVAIYMGLDSVFFPSQNVVVGGERREDVQFKYSPYAWGHYVLNYYDGSCASDKFNPHLDATAKRNIESPKGNQNTFPLRNLTQANRQELPTSTGLRDRAGKKHEAAYWRAQYQAEVYNKVFAGKGACDSLDGDMPIADVLAYVEQVVKNGLTYKPANGNVADCGEAPAKPAPGMSRSGTSSTGS